MAPSDPAAVAHWKKVVEQMFINDFKNNVICGSIPWAPGDVRWKDYKRRREVFELTGRILPPTTTCYQVSRELIRARWSKRNVGRI